MANDHSRSAGQKKWDQVLTKVRGMLDATLARVDSRLGELDQLANARPQDRLARHQEGLEQRLQRAGAVVEQTDHGLADSEKAVRDFMSNVELLRQKLVDWVEQRK